MTVKSYIVGRFQSFGVKLSEADLLDIIMKGGTEIDLGSDIAPEFKTDIDIKITRFIPSLLLRPNISESGFSMTRAQSADIRSYYDLMCKELGLKNQFKTQISFS